MAISLILKRLRLHVDTITTCVHMTILIMKESIGHIAVFITKLLSWKHNFEQKIHRQWMPLAFFANIVAKYLIQFIYRAKDAFIGLRLYSGVWKWADGSLMETERWKNQPNHKKDCAKAKESEGFVQWDGHECDKKKKVACSNLGL